ncbi:MAG: DUF998 domain-containing protein [Chloroflexota bacterium]
MSNRRDSFWLSAGGVNGVVTPLIAFTFIALSILGYPQFSWINNALSDLGIVPGITSVLFNFGLYVSGLLALIFSIGLYKFLNKNILGKIGAIIFAAASLALEGIGWAPENVYPFHYYFSVAFFTLVPISLLIITGYFLILRQYRFAAFTFIIAVLGAATWVLYFLIQYVPGVAIPEALSAIAGSVWTIITGWKMYQVSVKNI